MLPPNTWCVCVWEGSKERKESILLPEGTLGPACGGLHIFPFPGEAKMQINTASLPLYIGPSREERAGLILPFPAGLRG